MMWILLISGWIAIGLFGAGLTRRNLAKRFSRMTRSGVLLCAGLGPLAALIAVLDFIKYSDWWNEEI